MRTNARDLEDEDPIIVKEVVDLTQEGLVTADTDMLPTTSETP